ncbi:hypothetical protein ACLKA7_000815 [Drosophila subpalustris]
MEIDEMGSILEELIYRYITKQHVTRHVNMATKSMLHRLRELHGSVRAQLTETSLKLDDALSQIDLLQQPSAEEQQATKERIQTTQTTESKAHGNKRAEQPGGPKGIATPINKAWQIEGPKGQKNVEPQQQCKFLEETPGKRPTCDNPAARMEDHRTNNWTEVKR